MDWIVVQCVRAGQAPSLPIVTYRCPIMEAKRCNGDGVVQLRAYSAGSRQ